MNERINGLWWKARIGYNNQSCDPEVIEKFAELIVRECVQTLLDNTPEEFTNEAAEEDWDRGYDQAMRDCVHHIQEHFGVEEVPQE